MKRFIASIFITLFATSSLLAQDQKSSQKPFTINEVINLRRVGDPQLSPDGLWVAYTITDTDKAANRRTTQIYLVATKGGEVRQLTSEKASSSQPRWSPDGAKLAFI